MQQQYGKMIYIEDAPGVASQAQPHAMHGAGKYHGHVATGYDAKREKQPKWIIEQRIITDMLSEMPEGSVILDCPVGTMRFADLYHAKSYKVLGLDLSHSMLDQAEIKRRGSPNITLGLADIRHLNQGFMTETGQRLYLNKNSIDAAVMIRLTRYLSPEECQMALRNLIRVVKDRIIFTARVRNHPHARSYEIFQPVLDECGWTISRDEAGDTLDYRIIEVRPKSRLENGKTDSPKQDVPVSPAQSQNGQPSGQADMPRMKRWHVLTELATLNNWKVGAEVGVYNGYNAFHILDNVKGLNMFLVDNWKNDNDHFQKTGETAEEVAMQVKKTAETYGHRAVVLHGDSTEKAELVEDGMLDFVFIDASHETEHVLSDIRAWRSKVRKGGMILGHDIDWPSVQKAVYEEFKSNWREYPDDVWGVEVK